MKKISLHFGLNAVDPAKYGGWSGNLNACENDARAMVRIANERGFVADFALTQYATSKAFQVWCERAARETKIGDLILITYSGHGGQVADQNGDETDNLDETLCFWDGEVTDDWIKAQLAQFKKGVRIVTMFDSCHSETAARPVFPEGEMRKPKNAPASVNALATVLSAPAQVRPIQAHHLHFGGCKDFQVSYDGEQNGLFTGAILSALQSNPTNHAYRSLHSAARAICLPLQYPTLKQLGRPLTGFANQKFLQ